MTTIPARLAQVARTSANMTEASARARAHYREWYRAAPHIVDLYSLNIAPNYIRAAMRRKFDEHRHVSDPRTVDMLLVKGQQEYQETMNQWKMPDQLLGIMLQPQGRPPRTFMQKFLEGRDEDAALPAASGILRLP